MFSAAVAAKALREHRRALRLSQADLARRSDVSRYKLNQFELGSGELTSDELGRVQAALQAEIARLRDVASLGTSATAGPAGQFGLSQLLMDPAWLAWWNSQPK